jgi:hypothetical protein
VIAIHNAPSTHLTHHNPNTSQAQSILTQKSRTPWTTHVTHPFTPFNNPRTHDGITPK